MRIVFIVDDNLIGNKKAIKEVLRDVIAWQERNGYPLTFFTEASIDLADDAELMELMVEANFIAVFIGIESPNEESLRETKKFQNVRAGGTLLEKVHRIQDAGMEVWCGMIIGFDNDDASDLRRQIEFIQESRIAFSMSGMLSAIPKTPLYDRLAAEGRLDLADRSGVRHQRHPAADRAARSCATATSACSTSSTSPRPTSTAPTPCSSSPTFEIGITKQAHLVADLGRWLVSEASSADREPGPFQPADDQSSATPELAPRVPQAARRTSSRSIAGPDLSCSTSST